MQFTPVPTAIRQHSLFVNQVGEGLEEGFPFDAVLSFASVIEHWRRMALDHPALYGHAWSEIEPCLVDAPELLAPIADVGVLERNADLIARMTRPLFPASEWTTDAKMMSAPFGGLVVLRTARYQKLLCSGTGDALDSINQNDVYIRTLYAYRAVLKRFYNVDLRLDVPLIFMVPDHDNGLGRYFKFNAESRFVDIEARGALPQLSERQLSALITNVRDMNRWKATIPPGLFRFVGVTVSTLTDVTSETATSAITHQVLTSDANVTDESFDILEVEIRNLFGVGSLRLGLASLQADGALNVRSERRIWNSLVIRDHVRATLDWRSGPYGRALVGGESVIERDVAESEIDEPLKSRLLALGVRSLFLQPLRYEDRIVGLLELTSPEPNAVDASTILKTGRIEPILSLAVFQNLERFETRVESAIQRHYTAIHPSVQWRFREAAITMLGGDVSSAEPAPVVFEELYGLFGSADIRGSTNQRNQAARADAIKRLRAVQAALSAVRETVPLTILDEMDMRISRRIEGYEASWSAGDETTAARFVDNEAEPLLEAMVDGRDQLRPILDDYHARTHSAEESRTAAYESGRRQINRLISSMLLNEQVEAQKLYPHYFEHVETDGVEHSLYIGPSIAPNRAFDHAYVQNLRLRQLIVACSTGREVHRANESLPHPIEVAQLVVVQHAPVTLRFRVDEKRFDIDGPSGVRFEMLKKRLDKAYAKGTGERITQPNTVAVVYTTDSEAAEYARYVDYLTASGQIEPDPEVMEVEDLPGVSGLRALRLRVRM